MIKDSKVVVGREWADRTLYIMVSADSEGISSAMNLPDFLTALSVEIGNPAFVMTRASLEQKMKEAAELVIAEMKRKTAVVF